MQFCICEKRFLAFLVTVCAEKVRKPIAVDGKIDESNWYVASWEFVDKQKDTSRHSEKRFFLVWFSRKVSKFHNFFTIENL
ncbi:unnamed protein product [Hermetia illucens]|uniref:Uncharacterized protein n=1 Tax=Hermetia illucens TaxID=343691 RepID=A0A7R8V1I6_HERIL|nr:unnamed protein product [Hermetia illucens]